MVEVTYAEQIVGDEYTPMTISEMGEMIGKIAYSVIYDNSTKDRLAVFDKLPIKNGDTIEQAVVKLAESTAYSPAGSGALTREDSEKLAVRYFKDWTRSKFKKTIDISEIRKVLTQEHDVADVAAKIVSSMTEGDKQEKYEFVRDLFTWGKDEEVLVEGAVVPFDETNNSIDYTGTLIALKDVVKGMEYVNSTFNTAGFKRRTRPEDMYIIMPYKLKNRLDVGELATLFNLEKAEIDTKIIEVDVDADNDGNYFIYVVDKHAVLDFTRLYEMVNQINADGLFWNYFLHVERLYGLSPLFDGCYIQVAAVSANQGE